MKKKKQDKSTRGSAKIVVANDSPSESTGSGREKNPSVTPGSHGHSHRWRPAAIATGITLSIVGLTWVAGNLLYTRIAIGDQIFSGHITNTALQRDVQQASANYRLSIAYPNHSTKAFPLAAIGLQPDIARSLQALHKNQHSWRHRFAWWQPVHITILGVIHSSTLSQFTSRDATIVTVPPHDASLHITNGVASLDAEMPGKAYGPADADQTILEAAQQMQTKPVTMQPIALAPTITMQKLLPVQAKLTAILRQKITIHIAGQVITPSAVDIGGWLTLTNDNAAGVAIGIDNNQVRRYFDALASSYTQPAKPQILDVSGEILSEGQQGLQVSNTQNTADTLSSNLLNHTSQDLALTTTATPFRTITAPTTGKWIEVNVATKQLYAYDQGELVRNYSVTAGAPATPTILGRFAIYAKYVSQDMFGENVDGSRYFQPHVPYVNYFYADYAIHGNYWRPASYFGLVNSSHGCVGIPVDDSAWLYAWAPIGTPVIVHS